MLQTAILLSGGIYLVAATRRILPLIYLLKPGTMLLIITLAALGLAEGPSTYGWLILIGLLFSVAGDIFLMLPSDRFVAGLASFLMAHLFYVAAFWRAAPPRLTSVEGALVLALTGVGLLFYRRLARTIREGGKGKLLMPVALYILAISLMVWRAGGLTSAPFALPLVGALLFYVSDAALAWDRFVARLPGRHIIVMSTYFAAQSCMALSIAHL